MKKRQTKYYYLLGTLIMLIVAGLCSFTMVRSNLLRVAEKDEFEGTFAMPIDFIIPAPSNSQVDELEKDDNGIAVVTPYFETNTAILINGKSANGTALLFPFEDKMDYTPYSPTRIINGTYIAKGGCAFVDKIYANNNGCKVGDVASINISGQVYSFDIKCVTQANSGYQGTIALILSEADFQQIESEGIKFSAAYVSAIDLAKCEAYLENEYKPLGRLKDSTEFENTETYSQHVQNFNEADWSKEITNCRKNYEVLRVRYDNVRSSVYINIAISCVIVILVFIVFNLTLLKSESIQKFMKTFLIKKSGTKQAIKKFYKSGIRANAVVFVIAMIVLYLLLARKMQMRLASVHIINCIIPIAASIVTSVIMSNVCMSYVEKHYKVKRKKDSDEIEIEII